MTDAPLAAVQLAAAVALAPDRAVGDLGCFDPAPALGTLPIGAQSRAGAR